MLVTEFYAFNLICENLLAALCGVALNPKVYGYEWDDETAPKFQLAPMGWRGYIEGRAVRAIPTDNS